SCQTGRRIDAGNRATVSPKEVGWRQCSRFRIQKPHRTRGASSPTPSDPTTAGDSGTAGSRIARAGKTRARMEGSPVVQNEQLILRLDEPVLVTGASGFIGTRVVEALLRHGFRNLRCFVRPSAGLARLKVIAASVSNAQVELIQGNLLYPED